MNVEIWSDIMCPFCYIGKRKFEAALNQFEHKDQINIIWKSFQLNPDMKSEPGKSTVQHLAEVKGWSLAESRQSGSGKLVGCAPADSTSQAARLR